MTAAEIVRLIGGEFADVDDSTVEQWIELVRPMVSQKQFGKLYEQALAYLVCHKMKLAGLGKNVLGDIDPISAGLSVSSVSEGGSSISFGTNQGTSVAADGELGLTAYGVQYLSLRRMVIVPIHCGGESDV